MCASNTNGTRTARLPLHFTRNGRRFKPFAAAPARDVDVHAQCVQYVPRHPDHKNADERLIRSDGGGEQAEEKLVTGDNCREEHRIVPLAVRGRADSRHTADRQVKAQHNSVDDHHGDGRDEPGDDLRYGAFGESLIGVQRLLQQVRNRLHDHADLEDVSRMRSEISLPVSVEWYTQE